MGVRRFTHGPFLQANSERFRPARAAVETIDRHLRTYSKMKELMALSAGLPTIFQDREDVAAGKPCDGSATARPRWR